MGSQEDVLPFLQGVPGEGRRLWSHDGVLFYLCDVQAVVMEWQNSGTEEISSEVILWILSRGLDHPSLSTRLDGRGNPMLPTCYRREKADQCSRDVRGASA